MVRVLIVEDEANLQQSLKQGIEEEGYDVVVAATGDKARHAISAREFDAVLLDLMLPDGSGLQVLRDLRQSGFSQPILIITARDSVQDRVLGLDAGADDYLTKPFAFAELLARLRALLRRSTPGRSMVLRFAGLEVDRVSRHVQWEGQVIDLTKRQFDLLVYFLQHVGDTVSREMIAREVWKEPSATWTNVIDVHVNQLRKRLERAGVPHILHTVRGVGYQFGARP